MIRKRETKMHEDAASTEERAAGVATVMKDLATRGSRVRSGWKRPPSDRVARRAFEACNTFEHCPLLETKHEASGPACSPDKLSAVYASGRNRVSEAAKVGINGTAYGEARTRACESKVANASDAARTRRTERDVILLQRLLRGRLGIGQRDKGRRPCQSRRTCPNRRRRCRRRRRWGSCS